MRLLPLSPPHTVTVTVTLSHKTQKHPSHTLRSDLTLRGWTPMFSKLQKASDKVRIYLQSRACFSMFPTMANTSKVQALYDFCSNTFTSTGSPSASSQAIHKLCSLLDTVGPADVGITEVNQDDRGYGFFALNRLEPRWTQPITYLNIHEGDSFTMCIFCFPTSSVIPLHDHPGMTVFSKILYGSLHVKAYDWVEPACIQKSDAPGSFPVRLAKMTVDKVLTAPCETSILYPKSGGNVHCFTAITPCAVLDILTPPYREDAGRRCSYYNDYPYTSLGAARGAEIVDGKEEDYAWLAEIETPYDLYMRSGKYVGPAIQL